MPSLAAALRSEIRKRTRPELGQLARTLAHIGRQIEALREEVRQNGRSLARLESRRGGAWGGRSVRGGRAAAGFSAKAVRDLRARLALSRVRFARLLGVSPGSIFGWEKGRTVPGRASLALLAGLRSRPGRPRVAKGKPVRRRRRRGRGRPARG